MRRLDLEPFIKGTRAPLTMMFVYPRDFEPIPLTGMPDTVYAHAEMHFKPYIANTVWWKNGDVRNMWRACGGARLYITECKRGFSDADERTMDHAIHNGDVEIYDRLRLKKRQCPPGYEIVGFGDSGNEPVVHNVVRRVPKRWLPEYDQTLYSLQWM